MSVWLLEENALKELQSIYRAARNLSLSAEQIKAFKEEHTIEARDTGAMPRNMSVAGDLAEIRVEGLLVKSRDIFAWYFGVAQTSYRDIITGLAMAKADPSIKSIVFSVDSPGGNVDGLFDAIGAIQSVRGSKPMSVRAANAQSAAFAIAAAVGKIEAANKASTFGSIGVAVSIRIDETLVTLTNTDSPDKRPDVTTPEGKAVYVRQLDAYNELFVDAIVTGRDNGVTSAEVKSTYGRGATLLAGEAKKLGMIDSIAKPALRAISGGGGAGNEGANTPAEPETQSSTQSPAAVGSQQKDAVGAAQEKKAMDLKTLKKDHPEIAEALVSEGVKQEHDRVVAHITMGRAADAIDVALEAIEKSEPMTATMNAKYFAAGMNRADRNKRQQDSDQAGAATQGAEVPKNGGKSLLDHAADAYCGKSAE